MNITLDRLKLLLHIGQNPELSKEQLAEETGLTKRKVSRHIYGFREHGLVVKTVRDEDREKGLRWELTGEGKRTTVNRLKKLGETLAVNIEKPEMHTYKPVHKRGNQSFRR